LLRKIAAGLNRVWTGLFLEDDPSGVCLAMGLDLTTSPVSDIFLTEISLGAVPPGLEIALRDGEVVPELVLRREEREFRILLTLPRFEFLRRVADGAMPSSFSREACADFMSVKQRCLRDLKPQGGLQDLKLIEVGTGGALRLHSVYLQEQ
jgi:hypothetical protein